MIVARGDGIRHGLPAYEDALEPKRLVLLDGDHFAPHVKELAAVVEAAGDRFAEHRTA